MSFTAEMGKAFGRDLRRRVKQAEPLGVAGAVAWEIVRDFLPIGADEEVLSEEDTPDGRIVTVNVDTVLTRKMAKGRARTAAGSGLADALVGGLVVLSVERVREVPPTWRVRVLVPK